MISGCIFSDLIIAANFSPQEQLSWNVDIIQSYFQDIFITPLVYAVLQYFLLQLLATKLIQRVKIFKKVCEFYLSHPIHELSKLKINSKTKIFPEPTSERLEVAHKLNASLSLREHIKTQNSIKQEKL